MTVTLPPCYALFKSAEGWQWIWKNPGLVKATCREGLFDTREEARVDAWASFSERLRNEEIDEDGKDGRG